MEDKELLDLVMAGVAVGNSISKIAADGKVGLDDLPAAFAVVPKIIAAIEGIAKVPAEVLALSDASGAALVAAVAAELSVGDEKAKEIALASLSTLLAIRSLVMAIVAKPAAAPVA